jgi:hypothetical protein
MGHASARLTVHGRRLLVERVQAGWTTTMAARAAGIGRQTATKRVSGGPPATGYPAGGRPGAGRTLASATGALSAATWDLRPPVPGQSIPVRRGPSRSDRSRIRPTTLSGGRRAVHQRPR